MFDQQEPELGEITYTAELLRDVEPGHERAVFEAIKPMLGLRR